MLHFYGLQYLPEQLLISFPLTSVFWGDLGRWMQRGGGVGRCFEKDQC